MRIALSHCVIQMKSVYIEYFSWKNSSHMIPNSISILFFLDYHSISPCLFPYFKQCHFYLIYTWKCIFSWNISIMFCMKWRLTSTKPCFLNCKLGWNETFSMHYKFYTKMVVSKKLRSQYWKYFFQLRKCQKCLHW